ncbi:MAG TPA: tyrosine-type recombinase/integrase [Stellaceae bacterium]|jgi:integrase
MRIRLRDRTGTRDYKFVVEDVDRHGNVRVYFRRKGQPKIRLLSLPGSTEFEREYMRAYEGEARPTPRSAAAAAAAGAAPALPGTMRWLCQQYYSSAAFQALGESTRKVRRGILDGICQSKTKTGVAVGTLRYAIMEPHHVAKLRDEKATLPGAANARVKALRQLFMWASSPEYRYADKNPAREVAYLKSNNPNGFRAWAEADVSKYEARHPIGTKARLALDLLRYTGVRRSDVVKLGPQMERGGKLIFTETKGRARIVKTHELPILLPLRASIDATPSGHLAYLVTAFGKPHTVKGFGNWFARRCREAGLDPGLSAHGLRKLGARRCAEAGATEHQLMALFGWASPKQAALYTRNASRARLEAAAAPLLLPVAEERIMDANVPLFPVAESSGTISGKKR